MGVSLHRTRWDTLIDGGTKGKGSRLHSSTPRASWCAEKSSPEVTEGARYKYPVRATPLPLCRYSSREKDGVGTSVTDIVSQFPAAPDTLSAPCHLWVALVCLPVELTPASPSLGD